MLSDIEIARATKLKPISEIAESINIDTDELDTYGKYIAKIPVKHDYARKGKLILVTAISATKTGIGKTTVSIGLALGLNKIGKSAIVTLREPSLGPCFGMKGGAAGGGYAQVLPMEKINLHFTGDFHAITAAHNLIAAMLDNYIYQRRKTGFSFKEIMWKRVLDVNDRSLRNIITGLGATTDGIPRQAGFDITAASEIMAILCLAADEKDMRARIGRIVLAVNHDDTLFTVEDLGATGAAMTLLADAIKPNLVQTTENTPAIIHGGPFANIAHGCSSVISTRAGLELCDYSITEAGFGADLGAEKFYDIVGRTNGLMPDLTVIVVTASGLKFHGGADANDLFSPNVDAVKKGLANLNKHVDNIRKFGQSVVVVLNRFSSDTDEEINAIFDNCRNTLNVPAVINNAFAQGGEGAVEMAQLIDSYIQTNPSSTPVYAYDLEDSIETKIEKVAKNIYGAKGINLSPKALKGITFAKKAGLANAPICIAKTQYSFSGDAKKLGVPTDFELDINDIVINAGANMIVVIAGSILRLPGLPAHPQAENIDYRDGEIIGLS
jgi:formate--tetrahydrofolate ligase